MVEVIDLVTPSAMLGIEHTLEFELHIFIRSASVLIKPFTNNKPLFDVISKGAELSERRYLINMVRLQELSKKAIINDINSIRSSGNLTDGWRK